MTAPSPSDVISTILRARSVAVVGASEDGRKPSGRTVRYLRTYGFDGSIHPINPNRDTVQGLPAVTSIADLREQCDLAVIVLPQTLVTDAIRECGEAGIRVAIVFASGYSEIGAEGARREQELVDAAREAGVRVIGPNCVGVVAAATNLTATFMTGLDQDRFTLHDDGIAFVSQSGAMGAFILNLAQSIGVGLGRFFSVGNEADLTFSDIVDGLIDEGSTRVIAGYVEGITDGPRFERALARAQERGIPVVLVKVGTSERGAAAAASHTGALAGTDRVYSAVFERYGVHRADSVEQLLDMVRMLASPRQPRGEKMTIVTLSGGAGALMTDYAEDLGIDVFPWAPEWRTRLDAVLPAFASTVNPVDMTGAIAGDLDLLSNSVRIGVENPDTHSLMIVLGNMEAEEDDACARIAQIARSSETPVIVTWVGGSGRAASLLAPAGVPVFSDPARAMRAVSAAIRSSRPALSEDPAPDRGAAPAALAHFDVRAADEVAAKALLAAYGVPTVAERACETAEDAVRAAEQFGFPVVVKLLSSEVAHKSDIGGVRLGLADAAAVRVAAEDILAISARLGLADARLVVQRGIAGVHEIILGMSTDPTFGPVVAVGMGGVFTELLADVQLGVAPLSPSEARRMLESLQGIRILRGMRGTRAADENELIDAVVAFSHLAADLAGTVDSVEINPLLIDAEGHPVAVDALVIPASPVV